MSDPISEADKIRNKRIAKLGSQAPSSSGEPKESPNSPQPASSQTPKPKINISRNDGTSDTNPFTQLGLKAPQGSPASKTQPTTTPAKRDSADVPRPRPTPAPKDSLELWEDKTLGSIFRITLNAGATKDIHDNTLYFLASLRSDLDDEGVPTRLSIGVLEQAIIEAATNQKKTKPLDYLLACWKRISRSLRGIRGGGAEETKYQVLREAMKLCMSYCIFAVTMPEAMFEQPPSTVNPLKEHLLVDPENDRGICHDFLTEAVSRFEEDESIKDALVTAIEELSRDLAKMSMNDNYKPYVTAMRNIVRYPPLITAITESPNFIPANTAAQDIERSTILGPFFQLSPMQGEVAMNYFSAPKTRDRGYIVNSQSALRMTLQTHQNELFDIIDRFIKSSKEAREKTLDWFALCVNANHKRRAMRTDPRFISSDGFMINVTVCLDRLCEPFMDASFSKINRIEADYFRRAPRVNISDETKINADQTAADKFYGNKAEGSSNFISEVFFLTVAAHHYGTEAANTKMSALRKDLKHMDKEIERIESERSQYMHNPQALARYDMTLARYKIQTDRGHCVYHAIEGVLLDEVSQARSMSFMGYVIVWLIRLVSGADYPKQTLQLPLAEDQPEVFKCLPEYFIEDVVDHFKFITSHLPHVINATQCDELVTICITFLRSSAHIKNPYLKSGLVSILFYGIMPVRNHSKGILGDVLNSLPFALKHLLHALMRFYIDCEMTGGHNQFYDKFNIRYEIFQVIRCIWGNPVYRENLSTEAKVNTDFFVQFVNLLLNDVTFVLDESFSAFQNITSLTRELREDGLAEDVKKEKEEALEAAKGKAKSYMQLTTETLSMLKLFTDALADSFTKSEIVQRLADMLDYNLDALVGPRQRDLRVENREEYNFNPLALVSDIFDVYLNLSGKDNFQLAVARDGRSYKPSNFAHAASLMARHATKSSDELERWNRMCDSIARVKEAEDMEEDDLGEIPDEFLDPLMATLMQDPVRLPVSKAIMDRSTIRQHLLSDPHDPYSRAPLKIEDVIPDEEMKAKIDAFRMERKRQKAAGSTADVMDTTQ